MPMPGAMTSEPSGRRWATARAQDGHTAGHMGFRRDRHRQALAQPSLQWDTLCYHMPMVVDWMQHRALVPAYIPGAEIANSYFPGNGELLYYWVFAPFRNDLLVRTVNIGMWVTLGTTIYRIGRKLGAAPRPTLASTLLILAAPIVLGESAELMLDVAAAAVFLLAVGHLIEFARVPRLASAGLFAVAAGVSMGIKYSGPSFSSCCSSRSG